MVFQSYALYPHMTIRENLEFGLKIRKTPRAEMDRLVNEAAEILGISHLLDRKPKQLSGGQRQRVAVGRAIVRKPSVFLFDEPLSNLDAKLRVQMRAEITKLQHRLKTTTVYVTHDQVEAMTMGHRIAVMKDGKLQQVGTPLEVYEKPANVFVAAVHRHAADELPPRHRRRDGGATLDGTGVLAPGPAVAAAPRSRARTGQPIVVGIRARAPDRRRAGRSAARALRSPSTVEMIEPLGDEVIVHGKLGDDLLVAKLEPHRLPDDRHRSSTSSVELDALHLFDAATEQRRLTA